MNKEAQDKLNRILSKGLDELTHDDFKFLKARRSYMTPEQIQKFLGSQPTKSVEQSVGAVSYADLLNKAKALGYKGPRIPKAKLEDFIAANSL